uniref:Uncharacterized protein n=1 Tax=Siphoviridae sp. ctTrD1 TaxID=2825524 RepID=A0A8S5PR32_9CAUD|nr:MAG TPA: hypothetical protein [Siphoviridae sp. ctTrD1]
MFRFAVRRYSPNTFYLKIPYKIVGYFLDNSSIDKIEHMFYYGNITSLHGIVEIGQ